MRWWSESEGISYLTPIWKIITSKWKSLYILHAMNGRMKWIGQDILSNTVNKALLRFVRKLQKLLKKYICKECEDVVNQKGYLIKHQYQDKKLLLYRRKFKNKKIIKWKPKSVWAQSQNLAWSISFKGF